MTSRPGPGIHESLQSRASGVPPRSQVLRRPSKPTNTLIRPDLIDPALEDDRSSQHNSVPDPARPPPLGKPQLYYSTIAGNGVELPIHSFPYQPTVNLPAPPRPGSAHLRHASSQYAIVPGGSGVKDPPKLNAQEAAAALVSFPGGRAADLSPWTGTNAEDTLSEALVKGGVSNKPQIMNETNTARPSLWSNLKNKSGLTTLSTLFVAVLEKRQQNGRLHAPNTFKPPPRLTLRDSTREQWLHDLANPTIGLRRLSRTIPHGLTGKVLLEQCLNKNIPFTRALWLAKCVGINELRAHKRKGQAGTMTWSRGWTSSVEQFLDGIIGTIGQGDWKPRITYALQLATLLYKEHLLDDDHFLDWIIHGLDTCPSERLFVWLLIVSVSHYWIDITCCRRRGKRLAEALLNQLEKIYRIEDQGPFAAIAQYLETTVLKLMAARPACLLLPATWEKHGSLLKTLADRRCKPEVNQMIKSLDQRNKRLLQFPQNPVATSQTPAARVYHVLDSVNYQTPVRIDDLSLDYMEIITDSKQSIAVLLQWACSSYREGAHRAYLAIRLLRKWTKLGADVYEAIISFLQDKKWADSGDVNVIFKIVGELVRSKTFAVGRYLQWLIATGACDADDPSSTSWPLQLITQIPLSSLSEQIRTLRSTLLRGTAYSSELEEQSLRRAKQIIAKSLPTLFGLPASNTRFSMADLGMVSTTVKMELGVWLRQQVAQYAEINEHVPTKDPSMEETAAVSLINASDLHIVRSYLEEFGDLAVLADVIGIATSSLDSAVLASVADTLNFHLRTLRAIGAFDPLYMRLATRYAAIRTVRFPERELLLSLSNLARVVRTEGQLQQLLAYDLSRLDQRNSIAACSPASDSMGEVSLTGASSEDEIERILVSGNSMDHQMMARVLRKIISNLEENVAKGNFGFENYSGWFHRLRSFDEPTFDIVLNEWLDASLSARHDSSLRHTLPTLVGCGCLELSIFQDKLQAYIGKFRISPSEGGFRMAHLGVSIVLFQRDLNTYCAIQDAYRYRMEQEKVCYDKAGRVLEAVSDIVELGSTLNSSTIQGQISALMSSAPVLWMFKHCILSEPSCISQFSSPLTGSYFKSLLYSLLDPSGHLKLSQTTPEQQVPAIFGVASELSLPLCQAAIECIFSTTSAMSDDSASALSAALLGATKNAIESGQSAGLELLANLDSALTDQIRQDAEQEIINASTLFTSSTKSRTGPPEQHTASMVKKYLSVIDLTTSSKTAEPADEVQLLVALTDRLRGIALALAEINPPQAGPKSKEHLLILDINAWLKALLRLAIMHCSSMLRNASQQNQIALMSAMKTLITHPTLEMYPSIADHVFDVAIILSDYIPEEVKVQLGRPDLVRSVDDLRCLFIMGTAAPVDGWLVLTKPINTPATNQASSRPQTPVLSQSQSSPFPPPQSSNNSQASQQRQFNQQLSQQQSQQQRQMQMQSQQSQQMRAYSQYAQSQASSQHNKMLPAQLQRHPSNQGTPSPLQQMQQMQAMQQRATQPSPVYQQRPPPAAGSQGAGNGASGPPAKLQLRQDRESRQYPFVQPRWEILAESSGNPNANDTAISLTLFGARKV